MSKSFFKKTVLAMAGVALVASAGISMGHEKGNKQSCQFDKNGNGACSYTNSAGATSHASIKHNHDAPKGKRYTATVQCAAGTTSQDGSAHAKFNGKLNDYGNNFFGITLNTTCVEAAKTSATTSEVADSSCNLNLLFKEKGKDSKTQQKLLSAKFHCKAAEKNDKI